MEAGKWNNKQGSGIISTFSLTAQEVREEEAWKSRHRGAAAAAKTAEGRRSQWKMEKEEEMRGQELEEEVERRRRREEKEEEERLEREERESSRQLASEQVASFSISSTSYLIHIVLKLSISWPHF